LSGPGIEDVAVAGTGQDDIRIDLGRRSRADGAAGKWSGRDRRPTLDGMYWISVPSPIGPLGVAADGSAVCAVRFTGPAAVPVADPDPVLRLAAAQLDGYFAGSRQEFTLPLTISGGSDFERAVWEVIARIPYGEMLTYGEIAAAVGVPDGARAVGIACNHNPLPIVIACHRVVGAGGKLVGFGGGLPRKRFLLELEARVRIEEAFAG